MSLNPYEIRLELLKLAQTTLNEKTYNTRQGLMDKFHASREIDPTAHFPNLPEMPSMEDIIKEAKKLNDFVSNSQ
jgi:hypothetical protein